MATGNRRTTFCGPPGEDIMSVLCKTARRNGVGAEIRTYQIVSKHVESWNITIGENSSQSKFIDEWEQLVLTTGEFTLEEWEITAYIPEKITIQTQFPNVTEPWEITNQFFHISAHQDEWDVTEYVTGDSFGNLYEENWEIT